jgi:hypothetical protein
MDQSGHQSFQADGLNNHQQDGHERVSNGLLGRQLLKPADQKMQDQHQVDRNQRGINQYFDDKAKKSLFRHTRDWALPWVFNLQIHPRIQMDEPRERQDNHPAQEKTY